MALGGIWLRTLVYFGIAEEDEDWDEDGYVTNEELERTYSDRERANVRRLQPRRRQDFDDWTDSGEEAAEAARPRSLGRIQQQRPTRLQAAPNADRSDESASVPGGRHAHHHSVDVVRIDPDDSRPVAVGRQLPAGDPPAQGADAQPGALRG